MKILLTSILSSFLVVLLCQCVFVYIKSIFKIIQNENLVTISIYIYIYKLVGEYSLPANPKNRNVMGLLLKLLDYLIMLFTHGKKKKKRCLWPPLMGSTHFFLHSRINIDCGNSSSLKVFFYLKIY